jgi:hypothetical protein
VLLPPSRFGTKWIIGRYNRTGERRFRSNESGPFECPDANSSCQTNPLSRDNTRGRHYFRGRTDVGAVKFSCKWNPGTGFSDPRHEGNSVLEKTISFPQPTQQRISTASSFSVKVTLTDRNGVVEHNVKIESSSPTVCTVKNSSNTVKMITIGDCVLTASSASTPHYLSAKEVTRTVKIIKSDQNISFTVPTKNIIVTDANFNIFVRSLNVGLPVTVTSNTPRICTVLGGKVTIKSAGACQLTASQIGNNHYNPAPDVTQTVNIGKANQTITFADPADQTFFAGATFEAPATSSSGLLVTLASNTTPVCTIARNTVTIHSAGVCQITASQAGNNNYNAAPSVVQTVNIGKANQTITFADPADQSYENGGAFVAAATSSSGLPITMTSGPVNVCANAGNTVTIHNVGVCQLSASQAGNNNYNAAPSVIQTVSIGKANQTITFADPADQSFAVGATFNAPATSSSGLAVTLVSNTTPVCTITGNTVIIVTAGDCQLTASQAGDTNYNAATDVSNTVTIGKADQTITFVDPADQPFVADATFDAPATSSSGLAVILVSNTAPVCTVAGNTVTIVTAGDCQLTASQAGDTNYNAATDVSNTVSIGKADQTITFADPADQPFVADATFEAPATSSSELAVTITSDTPDVCTISGKTVTIVTAGDCQLTAAQDGDVNYNAAEPVSNTVGIGKADQTITFEALTDKIFGDADFTVTATGGDSGNPVTFTAKGSCTVTENTVTLTNGGTCTIIAAQEGNTDYNAAEDVSQSFTIADNDGVADSIEKTAPNSGDGNNDGKPDSEQTDVTSLVNTIGDFITMEVSGGCSVSQAVAAVNPPVTDPLNYTYPLGLLEFRLPCETATVKVYYHGVSDLDGYDYRKYGPVPPDFSAAQWYTLDTAIFGSEMIDGNQVATVQFNLADAGLGDDTGDDGVIVDAGGPGLPVAVTPPPVVLPPAATPSAKPIPVLGPWMILLLSGLLGLIGSRRHRRE